MLAAVEGDGAVAHGAARVGEREVARKEKSEVTRGVGRVPRALAERGIRLLRL